MAEVLSQSQIDALLNAARNGEMDLAAKAESSSEKKYRKYDFYSPRKFTKDRLKMLSGIFENYTRIINSRINGLLHTTCEIDVESVEEQRYYEFSNALLEGDVLALADVALEGQVQPDETPVLFHFSTTLMLSMMDRLMGGDGDVDSRLPAGYNFTNLELRLYESIAEAGRIISRWISSCAEWRRIRLWYSSLAWMRRLLLLGSISAFQTAPAVLMSACPE